MSHLVAHGHAESSRGDEPTEQSLGSVFLNDDGRLVITIESPAGFASEDITISFPASTVEDAVRRRIRQGRAA